MGDHRLVEGKVDRLSLRDQPIVDASGGAGADGLMGRALGLNSLKGRRLRINLHRLALEEEAELEGVADQAKIDMGHLHSPLGNGDDQPLGLQPGHELANRAEREARHLGELALGDELSGPDLAAQDARGEALVSPVPQLEAVAAHGSAIPLRPPSRRAPTGWPRAARGRRRPKAPRAARA